MAKREGLAAARVYVVSRLKYKIQQWRERAAEAEKRGTAFSHRQVYGFAATADDLENLVAELEAI